MKLQLMQILDRGVPLKERLWIKVLASTDLNYYLVFDSEHLSPVGISTDPKHIFWFPKVRVNPGDNIILMTAPGVNSTKVSLGITNRYFYWGLKNTIWDDRKSCAVLIEINTWETTRFQQ